MRDPSCHPLRYDSPMPDAKPFYAPDYRIPERQPRLGFKLWELRNGDRVHTCELRDDERAGAGVDLQLREGWRDVRSGPIAFEGTVHGLTFATSTA